MDVSRIDGGYLKRLLRGEKFAKTYAEEQKRRKKEDDEAFAAYCRKAEAEEIADQKKAAAEGLIGRARRQRRHEMCEHGAVAREKGTHGQHAEHGFQGTHETHGLPDVVSGKRPGVELFHKKSANVRFRGKERSKMLRKFKFGFVISYLWEFRDQMRDCFTVMDKDGSGELNKTEFEDGLHETLGIMLSKSELDAVFDIVDVDKSGHIEWHEIHACIRSAPKVVFVGLEQFYDDMCHLGYSMNEQEAKHLYHRVCLQSASNYDSDKDGETEKVELRRIRYIDLHKALKPHRMKNLRRMLRDAIHEDSYQDMVQAEEATGNLWRIERTTTKTFRLIRDMKPELQKTVFQRFRHACSRDEGICNAILSGLKRPTMAMVEVFEEMMKDTILKVNEHELHTRLYGPDKTPPVEEPLTPTERAGMMCAVSYVRAVMNEKLTRVRDVFRKMDADNGGDINEAEFRYGLRKVGVSGVTSQDVSILFKALDKDKGGTLTYQELRNGLRERSNQESLQLPSFCNALTVLGLAYLFEDIEGEAFTSKKSMERAMKLFHHISRRCKWNNIDSATEENEYRRINFKSMAKSIAHIRFMKHKKEQEIKSSDEEYLDEMEESNAEALARDDSWHKLPVESHVSNVSEARNKRKPKKKFQKVSSPQPPPQPPPNGQKRRHTSAKTKENSPVSPKLRSASPIEKIKDKDADAGVRPDVEKKFNQVVKMFVESVEMKLIEMGEHFPHHIKTISYEDFMKLKILSIKEQNDILDQMYVRLCGPGADPEEIKQIIRQREMAFGHRHKGCVSCQLKLQHAIGEEMFNPLERLSRRTKKKLDEPMAHLVGKLPDWLHGHHEGTDPVFKDWTISTLLNDSPQKNPSLDSENGDGYFEQDNINRELQADQALFEIDHNTANAKTGTTERRKLQTARSPRYKDESIMNPNSLRLHSLPATAPLGKSRYNMSGRGSPRERRLSPGFNISSPKSLNAAMPGYIVSKMTSRGVARHGQAQNSSLSLVKSIYNHVPLDPHDKEYCKHHARAAASYDRLVLPRTDFSDKLARLGAYQNSSYS